ncbi:MAG: competence/damage-inducible protein A [Chloroflexota bacterium]
MTDAGTPDSATPELSPIEIFSIGTELVIGRIQDTNSFWLSQQLTDLGQSVARITVVGDDKATIIRALRDAVDRGSKSVITTGGLGPTPDDLTVECVAELAGVGTVMDRPTVLDYLHRRQIKEEELTPALKAMATVPIGSEVHPSPAGWAPLIHTRVGGTSIWNMPGPPTEVQGVFARYLADHFGAGTAGRRAVKRVYVDMWESEVSPMLQQVMDAVPGTYCKGYIALGNQRYLPIDVVVRGESEEDAHHALDRAVDMLAELVTAAGREFQRS